MLSSTIRSFSPSLQRRRRPVSTTSRRFKTLSVWLSILTVLNDLHHPAQGGLRRTRTAIGHVATTEGIKGEDVCDLMVTAVEHRFGRVNRLPQTIEWLTDNGSCFIAGPTRRFAREIGLEPLTTPIQSPQSNGMAEAFVRTFKRDYVSVNPAPDARTVSKRRAEALRIWA